MGNTLTNPQRHFMTDIDQVKQRLTEAEAYAPDNPLLHDCRTALEELEQRIKELDTDKAGLYDAGLRLGEKVREANQRIEEQERQIAQHDMPTIEHDQKLFGVLDAAVEVAVFSRDNEYPALGTSKFVEFSGKLETLRNELRKLYPKI